jgi:hypothetical protein
VSYVDAGYSIVLAILSLYGAHLIWRRRRLNRTLDRVVAVTAREDDQ